MNDQILPRIAPVVVPEDEDARMALMAEIAEEGKILFAGALKRLGE